MSKIDVLCNKVVNDIDGSLACGVVDLETGMFMGVHHTIPYFTQDYLDAVAAAAVDLFRGKNITRIENLIAKQRGTEPKHSFQEMFIQSDNTYHFMKIIENKNVLVVLITKKTTNQGMGWSSMRLAIPEIRELLP